jgi:tetratricopeptide (TPR) repeat protein
MLHALFLAQTGLTPTGCDAVTSSAIANEARRAASERRFDIAATKFQAAFDSCPGKRDVLLEKANALFMGLRFADARAVAENILRTDSGNAAALKIKGNSEYFLSEFGEAIATLITLLDRHPDDQDGAYMLGRIYYQEGRIGQAIGQFERVVKLNPQAYKAWDNLGLCWQASGDTQRAIANFLQAIRLVEKDHPEYDWVYANLADLLIKTGDSEHAFAAASKAVNRNPNSARNFYIGAKALHNLGKTDLCLNWLQRASALDPNYSEAVYLMVRVYHQLGQEEKAKEARKKFLELKAKEPGKRR